MNILIILEDAVRPHHMSCYGYPKPTTPHCDRLAREGVLFRDCISVSSHTLPPVVSIITGQDVASHHIQSPYDFAHWAESPEWVGRRTPLHLLRDRGFAIDGELVTRWGPLGFDRDDNDLLGYLDRHREGGWFYFAMPYPTHLPYNPPPEYYDLFVPPDYHPDVATQERLDIVRTRMILHPPDVVSAMEAGRQDPIGDGDDAHKRSVAVVDFVPEQDRPGVHALYDGELRVFDDMVGRWVAKLEEVGQLDDTLIVITSDHGEELLERGHIGHTSCNLKGTLYDECVRVPLLMRYPKGLPQGVTVEQQVSQVDIMPTILDLLGVPLELPHDGQSALGLIGQGLMRQDGCVGGVTDPERSRSVTAPTVTAPTGPASAAFRQQAFAETMPAGWQALEGDNRRIWMVREQGWKLILNWDPETREQRWELYDLRRDPGELTNVCEAEPEQAGRLREALLAQMSHRLN
ncbi:sulfatase-like hydrolase/transferase [bacterium]|nr:sulfatase-like hydrolase/transferase [bacterium]